ncbi:MipA/OmpV family protein [Agaribacter marinus]|uniref:Structural protein MipA n=1 Tax=Agaribacter marinus TaxID=1431249 RepID=A0AA37SYK4_9ALTE|nr:MipA/OmpV family protein [Agaribacter marinus]GLR71557.1 structural protein MipA [Agaribacter marinus]
MMSNEFIGTLLFSAIAVAASPPVLAEEPESRWGLGLGLVISDQGYIDVSNEVTPVPVVYYQTENFQLLGPNFSYKLAEMSDLTLDFVGQLRFDGFEEGDSDTFRGMEDRSGSFDLGLSVGYQTGFGDFSAQFITDATNEHKGNEFSLTYSTSYNFETYNIKPYLTLTRQSEDIVDYYYGVRSDEETQSRALYIGEATTNVELGVQANWRVGQHHNFITYASYTAFGSEIKDSPLVDASGSANLILGYMYVF